MKVRHVREPLFSGLDPFFGAAIVALGAGTVTAGAPLCFDEAT